MKVNWSKFLFINIRRRRKNKIVGHNIFSYFRYKSRSMLLNGLCISIKSKHFSLLSSSITLKNIKDTIFFLKFPIYLVGSFNFKILGLTYGFNVNCSKLVEKRLK